MAVQFIAHLRTTLRHADALAESVADQQPPEVESWECRWHDLHTRCCVEAMRALNQEREEERK